MTFCSSFKYPILIRFGNVPLGLAPSEEGIHRTNVVVHRSWLKLGGRQLYNSPFKGISDGLGIQQHTVTTYPEIAERALVPLQRLRCDVLEVLTFFGELLVKF